MIKIDFSLAVSLYHIFFTLLVLGLWIVYNKTKDRDCIYDTRSFQQCPFCTHIFFEFNEEAPVICPQCRSYLTLKSNQPNQQPPAVA